MLVGASIIELDTFAQVGDFRLLGTLATEKEPEQLVVDVDFAG